MGNTSSPRLRWVVSFPRRTSLKLTTLEQYVELRLDTAKTLPASLIETTLNLPPGSQEVYLEAHLGDVEISTNLADTVAPPISAYLGTGTTLPPVPVVAQPKPPSRPLPQVRKSSPSPRRRDPTKLRGCRAEKIHW